MNLFYVVWDYIDEKLFDKRNTSDCAQFSELLGWPTAGKSLPTCSVLPQTDLRGSVGHILVLLRSAGLYERNLCRHHCVSGKASHLLPRIYRQSELIILQRTEDQMYDEA
jgi:hypothetical protein